MSILFPLRRGPIDGADGDRRIAGWSIESRFGPRIDPLTGAAGGFHGGVDLAHSSCTGDDMIAVADGKIVQSIDGSLRSGGGRWTRLEADDGTMWGYGHADSFVAAPGVHPLNGGARRVRAGEVIAHVGGTGGVTGAHLHIAFAPQVGAAYIDPLPQLRDASANGRFVGGSPIITTATTTSTTTATTQEDDMPDQFSFPDGTTYVLSITGDSDTGFAWVHIGSPLAQIDGRSERMLSQTVRQLAQGNDKDDALFDRHPVLSGPHRRLTHV